MITNPEPDDPQLVATDATVFDGITGVILRCVSAPFRDIASQATGPNEAVILGRYDDAQYRIEIGEDGPEAVLITDRPVTAAMIWKERDNRLRGGFDFDFADTRGVHRIGTTAKDMEGWDEVTKFAQALINAGQSSGSILILTDTGPAEVTAVEWQQILLAAAAFRQPLWLRSFELAAMVPIPLDYADDSQWT